MGINDFLLQRQANKIIKNMPDCPPDTDEKSGETSEQLLKEFLRKQTRTNYYLDSINRKLTAIALIIEICFACGVISILFWVLFWLFKIL